jgi:hypothetical protein
MYTCVSHVYAVMSYIYASMTRGREMCACLLVLFRWGHTVICRIFLFFI